MLANVPRLRTGVIAVALATLAACDDPVALTDLRPEGDPEVLSVLVMNDSTDLFLETATFCKPNDDKRPGFVGTPVGGVVICDNVDLGAGADPVVDAVPTDFAQGGAGSGGWYVRIMFDELLDPTVEDLLPILDPATMAETGQFTGSLLNTQPVIVTCGGTEVAYDGYYSPSGNNVTWPLGPSLFIAPLDRSAIATGSDCTVEIKELVTDKDGAAVPSDQRGGGGEYAFTIAGLELTDTSPAPAGDGAMPAVIVPEAPVSLQFNAFIDPASITAAEVVIIEHTMADCSDAGTPAANAAKVIAGGDGVVELSLNTAGAGLAWDPESFYSITFTDDNGIADLAGGAGALPGAADFTLCFNTNTATP